MGPNSGSRLFRARQELLVLLLLQLLLAIPARWASVEPNTDAPPGLNVTTERELVVAITNNSIRVAWLTVNLRLAAQAWPAVPIVRTSNFTVIGADFYPILDLAFIESKIKLEPGVAFTFKKLELRNTRMRSGFEVDVFTASPGAIVRFDQMVFQCFSCLPVPTIFTLLNSILPATLPPNVTWAPPWCRTQPPLRACYNNTILIWSASSLLPESGLQGVTMGGGYVLEGLDTIFMCEDPVSEECGLSQGYDYCVRTKIQSIFDRDSTWEILAGTHQATPPPHSDTDPDGGGRNTGAIVGGVVGGTAFLAIAMAAVLVFWRRRRRRSDVGKAGVAGGDTSQLAAAGAAAAAVPDLRTDQARAVQPDLESGEKGGCDIHATSSGVNSDVDALSRGTTAMATATSTCQPPRPSLPPHHHPSASAGAAGILYRIPDHRPAEQLTSAMLAGSPGWAADSTGPAVGTITTLGESLAQLSSFEGSDSRRWPEASATMHARTAPADSRQASDKPVVVVAGIAIELASTIGIGSFGKVFRAVWQGRPVAVKVLQYGAELCRAVHNEVLLSQTLRHPNLVSSLYFAQVLPGGRLGLHSSGGDTAAAAASTAAAGIPAASLDPRPEQSRSRPTSKLPQPGSKPRQQNPQLLPGSQPLPPPLRTGEEANADSPNGCPVTNPVHAGSYSRFIVSGAPMDFCTAAAGGTRSGEAAAGGDGRTSPPAGAAHAAAAVASGSGGEGAVGGAVANSAFLTAVSPVAASHTALPLSSSPGAGRKGANIQATSTFSALNTAVEAAPAAVARGVPETSHSYGGGGSDDGGGVGYVLNPPAGHQAGCDGGPQRRLGGDGGQEAQGPPDEDHATRGSASGASCRSTGTSSCTSGMPDPEALAALAAEMDADGSGDGSGSGDQGGRGWCGVSGGGRSGNEPDVLSRWDEQRRRQAQAVQHTGSAALQLIRPALRVTANGFITQVEPPPPPPPPPAAAPLESTAPAALAAAAAASSSSLVPSAARSGQTATGGGDGPGGGDSAAVGSPNLLSGDDGGGGGGGAPASTSNPVVALTMTAAAAALPLEALWLAAHTQPSEGSSHGFLVMELCEGGSACTWRSTCWMGPEARPDLSVILKLALDIAYGMSYIHSMGVCHGDLKLSNVLLARSSDATAVGTSPNDFLAGWIAKVCDFGLSRVLTGDRTHVSTRPYGTPTHMAPELWTKGHMSQPADVYAFGITLWELATGERPYKGLNAARILHRVLLNGGRPPLPQWLPPSYTRLVTSCWSQSPKERPTFAEIVRHLEAMLAVLAAVTPR